SGEGAKLTGIEVGADVTATHTAAAIAGQGALATLSQIGANHCNTTIISGGKIITGLLTADNIQAGTLLASLLSVSTAYITQGSMISNAIIGNAHIINLDVSKLNAGSITSKIINLALSGGSGDVAIRSGKVGFGDVSNAGFILGIDDTDDSPKFEIGTDANTFMKWNPTDGLVVRGKQGYNAAWPVIGTLHASILLYSEWILRIAANNEIGLNFTSQEWSTRRTWTNLEVADAVYPTASVLTECWFSVLNIVCEEIDPKGPTRAAVIEFHENNVSKPTGVWTSSTSGNSKTANYLIRIKCNNTNTRITSWAISDFHSRYMYKRISIPV
ncbi:MAG: hypothetical protein QME78_11250, partial [Thermodesulfobacteriota bacterium]|nr:hypothetical protein [Thermodesulfobacteriota bacterium]